MAGIGEAVAKAVGSALPTGLSLIGQGLNQRETKRNLKLAQGNLSDLESQGGYDTAGEEIKNAYKMALDQYNARQQAAKYGYSNAELANARNDINKTQTAQLIAGREAGGGQTSKYLGAVLNNNKADNLLTLAASDAAMKLKKQQEADAQFGNVEQGANTLQSQKNFDLGNYRTDLTAAGKAISDLRMQKMKNREGIFNTWGSLAKDVTGTFLGGGGGDTPSAPQQI